MKRSALCLLLALCLVLAGCSAAAPAETTAPAQTETAAVTTVPAETESATREFTDSTGRTVTIPATITKIAISGPLSQVYMIPLAGDMLVGVCSAYAENEALYLPDYLTSLTEIGQLYGGKGEMDLEALLAVDKGSGLWVHPSPSRYTGTLANGVAGYFSRTKQPCGVHVVTRLDRDTFGVVLLAKHAHIHALLCQSQRAGQLRKTYQATVRGSMPEPSGIIDLPIRRRDGGSLLREVHPDGQAAVTRYRVLNERGGLSLLELEPVTGRTHQLRVHCAALGCPILGDRDYGGGSDTVPHQQLCAVSLTLPHPLTGEPLTIFSRQRPFFPKFLTADG